LLLLLLGSSCGAGWIQKWEQLKIVAHHFPDVVPNGCVHCQINDRRYSCRKENKGFYFYVINIWWAESNNRFFSSYVLEILGQISMNTPNLHTRGK
jgi:hypothetical protein